MNVSGNWQFAFMDSNFNVAALATGFLQQTASNVTGTLDINGCASSASVTGTVGGSNGSNSINLSTNLGGQTLTLVGQGSGTITPGSVLYGTYTVGAVPCPISGLTAQVSGQQVSALSGGFHGGITAKNEGNLTISGNLSQAQNSGGVTTTITGTGTVIGSSCFSSVNFSGTITGTQVTLNIASTSGSQTAQLTASADSNVGVQGAQGPFTITQLQGNYSVNAGSCSGDTGTFNVTFP